MTAVRLHEKTNEKKVVDFANHRIGGNENRTSEDMSDYREAELECLPQRQFTMKKTKTYHNKAENLKRKQYHMTEKRYTKCHN